MDLSIKIQDTTLYIRVAGIIKTPNGFLLEKKKDINYFNVIGGKITLNETSVDAIKREILEEIGIKIEEPIFCSIIENFFTEGENKVHEICFVYLINTIFTDSIPNGFIEISMNDIDNYNILPKVIVDILKNIDSAPKNLIVR